MIIAEETDAAAEAKWEMYKDGIDEEAVGWMQTQGSKDAKADKSATVVRHQGKEGAVNFNVGTLIGSFEKVAGMLDEIAEQPIKGIMLTFDDFLVGVENFGTRIQPLMKSRVGISVGEKRKVECEEGSVAKKLKTNGVATN